MNTDEFLSYLAMDDDGQLYDDSPYFIGMMSGTSLDALDAVLCRFGDEIELIATASRPFDDDLKQALLALTTPNGVTNFIKSHDLPFESELDVFGFASRQYGEFAGELVNELLDKSGLTAQAVSAIGCHGQTVRHRPEWGFSLQLLDPNVLAERTGIAVVSDFRRRDMAVGGQGAPLIPAFHQAIFEDRFCVEQNSDSQVVVLNLGGIANITVLGKTVVGYDVGVANLLMDGFIKRCLNQNYDKNGDWARSGQMDNELLDELLKHPFLAQPAPKSTGREAFNLSWLDSVLRQFDIKPQDVQATLCEFTAVTCANEITKFAKNNNILYVCGGGAYNDYLLSRLSHHLKNWQVLTTEAVGIAPSWMEAIGFAWLARQTIIGNPANLPAVTGATKAVVLGQVCFA